MNLAIIDSDNGLSPNQHQAIIVTSAGLGYVNWTPRNNFSEILIKIHTKYFHSRKCIWKCHLENSGSVLSVRFIINWFAVFIIHIWKQGSYHAHDLWNYFINMNKERKWPPFFILGCHLINLGVFCTLFVQYSKTSFRFAFSNDVSTWFGVDVYDLSESKTTSNQIKQSISQWDFQYMCDVLRIPLYYFEEWILLIPNTWEKWKLLFSYKLLITYSGCSFD